MNNRIITIFVAAALLLTLLAGCRSSSGTSAPGTYSPADGSIPPQQLWSELAGSYGAWTDVEMPVKLSLRSPSSMSLSGQVTMLAGEAVGISLRKLGFEVAKVYFDNDKVIVLSKFLRVAWTESFDKVTRSTGLTVADLQSALLGRVFVPGRGVATARSQRDFEITVVPADSTGVVAWSAAPRGAGGLLSFAMRYAAGQSELRELEIAVPGASRPAVTLSFDAPEATEAGPVASGINVEAEVSGRPVAASLEWKPGRSKWNAGASVAEPAIPENCRLVSTAELINILKNL